MAIGMGMGMRKRTAKNKYAAVFVYKVFQTTNLRWLEDDAAVARDERVGKN